MGMDTLTNFPFWRVGPVLGTKLPRRMPVAMERRIQRARKRSRRPRERKAECLDEGGWDCFSGSGGGVVGREGEGVGRMGSVVFCILMASGAVSWIL